MGEDIGLVNGAISFGYGCVVTPDDDSGFGAVGSEKVFRPVNGLEFDPRTIILDRAIIPLCPPRR
jgi:hypothetical protein